MKNLIECRREGRVLVWSSLEILSLSLFTPSNSIFDSQKKPNDSQDKFYFLSCGVLWVWVGYPWYSYWWCFIVQVKHISEIVPVFKSQNVLFLAQIKTFTDRNKFFFNLSCCRNSRSFTVYETKSFWISCSCLHSAAGLRWGCVYQVKNWDKNLINNV